MGSDAGGKVVNVWGEGDPQDTGVSFEWEGAGREYLADISERHLSRQAHAKHFRTST